MIALRIIFCVIMILILFALSRVKDNFASVEETKKPNEVVLEGDKNKKALIIYQQSADESTYLATMILADKLNEEKYTVVINYPSKKIDYNIDDFDVVALGSPVYAGKVSKALLSYIEITDFSNKNVLVFLTGKKEDKSKSFNLIKDKIKGRIK